MTPLLHREEDRADLKALIQEAVKEAMDTGCLCGLDPAKHRRHHELCPVTPEQAADNHRFVRDLRETATSALKKLVITVGVGVILLLLGLGAKGWIKGG